MNDVIKRKVFTPLENFINHNELLSDKTIDIIIDLINKKSYPDLFKKPNKKVIYRGLVLKDPDMKYYFDGLPDKSEGYKKCDFEYDHITNTSSWTTRKHQAIKFARAFIDEERLHEIVLFAKTENLNCLDLSGLYNVLKIEKGLNEEKEVIVFGDVQCYAFEWNTIHGKVLNYEGHQFSHNHHILESHHTITPISENDLLNFPYDNDFKTLITSKINNEKVDLMLKYGDLRLGLLLKKLDENLFDEWFVQYSKVYSPLAYYSDFEDVYEDYYDSTFSKLANEIKNS